jgi:hypothetical protein
VRAAFTAALVATALGVAVPPASADETLGPWDRPNAMVVSPDGRNVYATGSGTISFARDQATGMLTELDWHAPGGDAVAISPSGEWVYAGSPGTIDLMRRDPSNGELLHVSRYQGGDGQPTIGSVQDMVISPDGRELYVAQDYEAAVLVLRIDPATGELSYQQAIYGGYGEAVPSMGSPQDLELSADGRFLYLASDSVLGFARDTQSGRLTPIGSWRPNRGAYRLAVSPDGKRVYAGEAWYGVFDRDPGSGALTDTDLAVNHGGCDGCVEGGPITVSPDSGSVFNGVARENRLYQASPTPDGVALAHTYSNGADGFSGLTNVGSAAWSPDGHSMYMGVEQGFFKGQYPAPTQARVLVLDWNGSTLQQVQSVEPVVGGAWHGGIYTPGLTIDGGATYTNDPDVELKIEAVEPSAVSFYISSRPTFDPSELRRVSSNGRYRFRLDTSGPPERAVKHVYVHFTGVGAGEVLSDDIILDTLPPELTSARLKRVRSRSRLLLRASDITSGVQMLQLATDLAHPRPPVKFSRTVQLGGRPRRLYVRVIDNAGNASPWRRAARYVPPRKRVRG